MRLELLPSTIDEDGRASRRQHMLTIVINDRVAIDAGSLAFSCSDVQRRQVRDIVLTHTHLDHIAGLPLFIDDLFATLESPVCVHATREMIETLESDIFNWRIYPRFSELSNKTGPVLKYIEFERGDTINVGDLRIRSIEVNHKVAASGYIVSDADSSVAITGDTAQTEEFWKICNDTPDLKAVLVECAFPNELADLAKVSYHLTPAGLAEELGKLSDRSTPIYVINLKPMYRESVISQISEEGIKGLEILELGRVYDF